MIWTCEWCAKQHSNSADYVVCVKQHKPRYLDADPVELRFVIARLEAENKALRDALAEAQTKGTQT